MQDKKNPVIFQLIDALNVLSENSTELQVAIKKLILARFDFNCDWFC